MSARTSDNNTAIKEADDYGSCKVISYLMMFAYIRCSVERICHNLK